MKSSKIVILSVGRLGEAERALAKEYLKRLGDFVSEIEVTPRGKFDGDELVRREAEALSRHIVPSDYIVIMDERGQDVSSRQLATFLTSSKVQSARRLLFMIGGSNGLCPDLKGRAHQSFSFGKATWPHRLVRVMLLEQLYRAQQINKGHPYHRD